MDSLLLFAQKFAPQLIILAIIYMVVLLFVALDLWSGVRKARRAGEYRSSLGLRRTVDKLAKYYNLLLVISLVDALQMLGLCLCGASLPLIPILTLIAAGFIGFIEGKSIFEKASDKERAKVAEAARIARLLVNDHTVQGIATKVVEILTEQQKKKDVQA